MKLTGAQALIKSLEMEGVEVMFGLPGGCILPAYDPLLDSSIRHILVRHEQGAGHMAEGYAHVTGRPGVAMVTSGPAATNLVTPLCDAYIDSVPKAGIAVVTTLVGRGSVPDSNPLCLGRPGTHGSATAVTALQKADLLIALGARFDGRVTGRVSAFAPDAKVIHVDIDPAEQGKVRRPDVPIVGDCRVVIEELIKAVRAEQAKHDKADQTEWHAQLNSWR